MYRHFTDEIMELIVKETNRYAGQTRAAGLAGRSRLRDWKPTDVEEMRRYFGILLVMGLNDQGHVKNYWKTKSELYGHPLIQRAMTRDRFLLLTRVLHFADNKAPSTGRLHKIFPLISMLNDRFKAVLKPGTNLTVDESMRPWRGRLLFRVYNPNKTHKYGVKLYKLCTDVGYCLRFIVYTGKTSAADSKLPVSQKAVTDLAEDYLDEGRTIYADNWYSGIPLVEFLRQRRTLYVGTIRTNRRGLPADLVQAKLKKGEILGRQCQHGTKVFKWFDKRAVTTVSSVPHHTAELVDSGSRSRSGEPIKKPQSVIDYNSAKKGVDINDQMPSYRCFSRKGVKWYRKLALDMLLNLCMVNAWTLQKFDADSTRNIPIAEFREQVALDLLNHGNTPLAPLPNRVKHTLSMLKGARRQSRARCTGCYQALRKSDKSRKHAMVHAKKVST
ncbi:hypothetical protein FOCC_FOCC013888, partial [Frankliniella occidentalis]